MCPLILKLMSLIIIIFHREDQGGDFPVAENIFIIQHRKLVNDWEQIWRLNEVSKRTMLRVIHYIFSRLSFWLLHRSNVMDLYRGSLTLCLKSKHKIFRSLIVPKYLSKYLPH